MAEFFCEDVLEVAPVAHESEFESIKKALAPVLHEAYRHRIAAVCFELKRQTHRETGAFHLELGGRFVSNPNHIVLTRDSFRKTAGPQFSPLLPPQGLAKKLSKLMEAAIVAPGFDLSVMAAMCIGWGGWFFDAYHAQRLEETLGREWTADETFLPVPR